MDSYPNLAQATLDEAESAHPAATAEEEPSILVPALAALRSNASSLEEMSQRELQLTLQLLAQRMQYITGASAATIALNEGQDMLCRASAGPMATQSGAPLRADPALVAECIRQQQIICCNTAQNGTTTDGISYASLGVNSVMIMPLLRDAEVIGVLELLADRPQAFDDEDGAALEHLAEMVLTALEHSDAAKRGLADIANSTPVLTEQPPVPEKPSSVKSEVATETVPSSPAKRIENIRRCEACGFPVSEERTLCVDCENAQATEESSGSAPAFLSELAREQKQGWLQSHFYTIGTVLMVALTVVALLLKLR